MSRGTSSITSLLYAILFQIVPVFADIGVAVVWFMLLFDTLTGLVVLATMVLYIVITVLITEVCVDFYLFLRLVCSY
jgi:ATP-binding cassette, subfamily B (MDR/TAP), member 6